MLLAVGGNQQPISVQRIVKNDLGLKTVIFLLKKSLFILRIFLGFNRQLPGLRIAQLEFKSENPDQGFYKYIESISDPWMVE